MPAESNNGSQGQQGPQGPTEAPATAQAPTFEGTAPAQSLPEDVRYYPQYAFYGHDYGPESEQRMNKEERAKEWSDTLATRESLKQQIAARQAEKEKEKEKEAKEGKDK